MGLSQRTALEIYTNPKDLRITLPQKDGRYAILIGRGPGHNFKLLLSTQPMFESLEAALMAVEKTFEVINDIGRECLASPANPIAPILNPQRIPADELLVLTKQQVVTILADLRAKGEAQTYT